MPHYKAGSITQRSKSQSQRLAPRTTYKASLVQPRGREKNKETGEEEYAVRKNHSHHFCFSTLHSIIPNLSVGGVVAGTTPVIIDEEAALSSKGIGGNCALLTDVIQTSSISIAVCG